MARCKAAEQKSITLSSDMNDALDELAVMSLADFLETIRGETPSLM